MHKSVNENMIMSIRSCTLTNTRSHSKKTYEHDQLEDKCGRTSRAISRISKDSSNISEQLVFRKKKEQTQQLMIRYQEQKNCIRELQDYIEQLQNSAKDQDEKIQRLQLTIQMLKEKLQKKRKQSQDLPYFDELCHQGLASELKQKQLVLQLELQVEKYEEMKSMFESKLKEVEVYWKGEQKKWQKKVRQLEESNKQMIKENLQLSKQNTERQGINQLRFRKSVNGREQMLASKQNMMSSVGSNSELYKKQAQRLTEQLKKVKKQNIKLQKALESKQLDLQFSRKELERKDKKMSDMKQTSDLQQLDNQRQKESLNLKLQSQSQSYQQLRNHLEDLKLQHQSCQKRSQKQMYNLQENRKLRLKIREMSNAQFAKMDKLFDSLQISYDE